MLLFGISTAFLFYVMPDLDSAAVAEATYTAPAKHPSVRNRRTKCRAQTVKETLQNAGVQREVLPIPDKPYAGFVAYDAKDPDSKFPPMRTVATA